MPAECNAPCMRDLGICGMPLVAYGLLAVDMRVADCDAGCASWAAKLAAEAAARPCVSVE